MSSLKAQRHTQIDGRTVQTPTYICYRHMLARCYNVKDKMYYRYGGRGITVCQGWLGPEGFDRFVEDMGEQPAELMLDRIDNEKGYCKGNCRWATRKEQNRNTVRNRMIEIDGVSKCLEEWAEQSPVSSHCIAKRLRRGWPAKDAVFKPESHKGVARVRRRHLPEQVGVSPVYHRMDVIRELCSGEQQQKAGERPLIGKHEKLVTIDGVTKPLQDWCRERGVDSKMVLWRLKRGWDPKAAIETPALGIGKKRPGIRRAVNSASPQ